ncbi:DUF21-domain-containing protein [Aureobasidium namibiae CBS 147.97]|uniref:DUF21-domain-containing protein n=1 Tax=Aureobasidium namibiae CBS 147.97 TaxID=1043004 RepID=A0A074WSJ5_9PEZI|nr:DUF21-domain-containing protein [Aureobasidium namibiae CBS 147.97]KEQ74554.1 DUF21-domain-containing protein [Aureobasidium namibiae CBS 147.97]
MTPAALSIIKLLGVSLINLPLSYAAPLFSKSDSPIYRREEPEPKSPEDPQLWVYLGVAIALVLLGGVFAGLTIALMGQDEIYLQVIATSGEGSEKKSAARVLRLLKKGKHWVLVTLLLSNVITNETLPIVLDRSLGGGWPAVLSSTVLIVIFGEVVPQSICVRFGLPIGAAMSPLVLGLMWIMAPVAWPTAKLLDWLLGEDHGTVYKKAGLKTLVTLHKTLGTTSDRLNEDEVTIISAVLDLKDKPVGDIMTPMGDVFTMSADTVLDEKMMDTILSQGYSRIPIYAPDNTRNFIGMLLVKILITYDPEDSLRVRDFALATLPETKPETSCLDIVNFFQEGKSHMVLVSDFPGQDKGALGVVTLEDVIEELIGEEIIDESDVFVDVHKAIRRIAPAPRTRYTKGNTVVDTPATDDDTDVDERTHLLGPSTSQSRKSSLTGSREATLLLRRRSSTSSDKNRPLPLRSNTADLRQHLKHLGPSNVASRPKATKYTSVKIKPGVGTIPENRVPPSVSTQDVESSQAVTPQTVVNGGSSRPEGGIGAGLIGSAALEAQDGAHAVAQVAHGYGSISPGSRDPSIHEESEVQAEHDMSSSKPMTAKEASAFADNHTAAKLEAKENNARDQKQQSEQQNDQQGEQRNGTHESGSITENIVDMNGMKKVVLEANSSSDGDDQKGADANDGANDKNGHDDDQDDAGNDDAGHDDSKGTKKKKKKKRGGKKFRNKGDSVKSRSGDSTPLLSQGDR